MPKFSNPLKALFFDGKRDKTLVRLATKNKIQTEEHVTLVSEPGSQYVGHVTPTSGSSNSIKTAIVDFLNSEMINTDTLQCIGCDGTAVNTGPNGGIIALFEKDLGRPIQWIICLLHCLELPLRHTFVAVDGVTQGPRGFSGEIGRALADCCDMEICTFSPVEFDLIAFESSSLSNDQAYLYDILLAVKNGHVSPSLAGRSPGAMHHARWLTTASRILRLYVSQISPSQNLILLVTFVTQVYGPLWFEIKKHSGLEHGSRHFFSLMKRTRVLPNELQTIVHKCLERNSFFAHSENVILSLMCSSEIETREQGFKCFQLAKEVCEQPRKFVLPQLNTAADELFELLNTNDVWSPPPVLLDVCPLDLQIAVTNGTVEKYCDGIPCHSQAVERNVRLVSEASTSACGFSNRHGIIQATIESRKKA